VKLLIIMLKKFVLPACLPQRKILSVDIGGTLAKAAFYVPKSDSVYQDADRFKALTHMTIPCKKHF
jgi:hypothetical protein